MEKVDKNEPCKTLYYNLQYLHLYFSLFRQFS